MDPFFRNDNDFDDPPPPTGQPTQRMSNSSPGFFGAGVAAQQSQWVRDEDAVQCMNEECGRRFDFFYRRHHCRYCGKVFCDACSSTYAMLPESFGTKDPQRTCRACFSTLKPMQDQLVHSNANALRTNEIDESSFMRYFNSPARFTLGGEVRKAAYSMQNLVDGLETTVKDKDVSADLFLDCQAILFITVAKIAFIGGVRFGTGLVVARHRDGWSAPCAVFLAGLSFGAVIGAELTDMIIPLHDKDAVAHFSVPGGSHLMVGGEAGLAFGPIGRSGEASMLASTRGVDTAVSYSHSRGLYSGITLDGAVVHVRDDVNQKFYGYTVNPAELLDGTISPPSAAEPMYRKLEEYEASLAMRGKGRNQSYDPPPTHTQPPLHHYQQQSQQSPAHEYTSFNDVNRHATTSQQGSQPVSVGGNNGQLFGAAVSAYQSATPEQRQQAASVASSAYNSMTPEQRSQAARMAYNAATSDDNAVFI